MSKEVKQITEKELTKAGTNILNSDQLAYLFSPTPKSQVYQRPAKGGGTWDFVTGVYVKKVLNLLFGWDWDFKILEHTAYLEAKQIIVLGELTVRTKEGKVIVKQQFGKADVKFKKGTQFPLDLGNDHKAAATDALKKCAAELGIAGDIYGKKEFKEIKVIKDEDAVDPFRIDDLDYEKRKNRLERFIDSAKTAEELMEVQEDVNGEFYELSDKYYLRLSTFTK